MTTLAITPNWKNKSARFKGTVAAGEHVSVTILNDDGEGGEFIADASTLRLRVVDPCNGRTLAIFPEPVPEGETPEEWDSDLSPLRCTLNLNTVQTLKAVPPAANVPLLWVLDDYDNKTLYFKEQFPVEHWPRLRGEEEPTDLDNYKDIIADFNTRLTTAEENVATAAEKANAAAESVAAALDEEGHFRDSASASAAAAEGSATAAGSAATDAQTAYQSAEAWATGGSGGMPSEANNAKHYSEVAANAAEEAQAAKNYLDEHLPITSDFTEAGKAAEAKAVGDLVSAENRRAVGAEAALNGRITAEVTARETLAAAVGDNRQNLAAEIARAQGAEQGLENRKADKATTYTKEEVDAAVAAATPSDYDSVKSRLAAAEEKIPTQASAQNQLADKAFVNSSVATATATFRGTSDASTQAAFETWLDGLAADANDYVFWRTTDAAGNAVFKRYKYNGADWEWEFDLNNSSFTAAQWAAISSGITSGLVAKLGALPTAEALAAALAGKQDALTFDNAPTIGSNNPVKSGGIWSAIWGALDPLPTGFTSLYDWCVAQIAKLRDKLDLNVYERRCVVSFPAGYSITYGSGTYTAPSGGETIEFYGPISSTAVPRYNFWVPYEYKDATDFDPQAQTAWCLYGDTGNSVPAALMYGTGASYNIANWNTEAPTLTLSSGEATGDAPTMARPLGATGDTLAKASQLAEKVDKSGGEMTPTFTAPAILSGRVAFGRDAGGPYIGLAYGQNVAMLRPSRIELDGRKVALAAPNPTAGNLAALDTNGNPTDAGYRFEVRNGIPYIIETTND